MFFKGAKMMPSLDRITCQAIVRITNETKNGTSSMSR